MNITLLGTGTSEGMPAPLCSCDYCHSISRSRTSLLVETGSTALVFDASPDITQQLRNAGVTDIDSIFLTHYHHDHTSGLKEIVKTAQSKENRLHNESQIPTDNDSWFGKEYNIYLSPLTFSKVQHELGYVFSKDTISRTRVSDTQTIRKGQLRITAVSTTHSDDYLAYIIEDTETNEIVIYHPDYGEFNTNTYVEKISFDCAICDISSLLGYNTHTTKYEMEEFFETMSAESIVGTNVSEHLAQVPTDVLENRAVRNDVNVVPDGSSLL